MKFANFLAGTLALASVGGCGAQGGISGAGAPAPNAPLETQPVAASANDKKTGAAPAKITRSQGVPNGTQSGGLTVPRGFEVNLFATGLEMPRRLVIAPKSTPENWDVFVSESRANRVSVLRQKNGSGKADEKFAYSEKLNQPYGLAFHPGGFLYVGNTDSVVRLPYNDGATSTDAQPQKITGLTRGGYNQHWTRNVIFSRDAKQLYVTVGSSCNTCEEDDPQRAAISVMNPDGSARRVFANGLRNPVGVAWRPGTNELWTVVNERDHLGDDLAPDYLTHVADKAFYGWPYAYTDIDGTIRPDPNWGDKNPQKARTTVAATVPVQAHSAALGVAFYPNAIVQKKKFLTFPTDYSGDAFLAFHGSWNHSTKTGYKIVRVDFQNGKAVSISDFVTGFLKDGAVSGRPVDVAIAPDGSLLFSDDDGGKIWRVSYRGAK